MTTFVLWAMLAILRGGAPVAGPTPPARHAVHAVPTPTLRIRVDSARHAVEVIVGPFRVPNMPGMNHMSAVSETMPFAWPVDGWMRGFSVDVRDASGALLPREMLHHADVVNFDRRQLVYPAVERIVAASKETEAAHMPPILGIPLERGQRLGVYQGLHNESGRDIEAAYVHVTMFWTERRQWWGSPLAVLPFYADVNDVIGGVDTYDIPPGRSRREYEFVVPTSGRLMVVGGHLHDYGVSVRLEDAETGRELVQLDASRDKDGRVESVGRKILVWPWSKLRLTAGHRYRVVGEYDNPTGREIPDGGMAQFIGIFALDDANAWPPLDPTNPETIKDLATLPLVGAQPLPARTSDQR